MRYRFYDRNFHGRDLDAIERHFETYLPSVVRRSDLNAVLARAFGEVSISHLQVSGGDAPRPTQPQQQERTGLLGADIAVVNGGYRVARIFRADDFYADNPLLRNPLAQPGSEVAEGEYILAVDGQDVSTSRNFYSYFAGKAGVTTKLRVGKNPSGAGAREVTVTPWPGENSIRAADAARRNA
jgi:tricorn protease